MFGHLDINWNNKTKTLDRQPNFRKSLLHKQTGDVIMMVM